MHALGNVSSLINAAAHRAEVSKKKCIRLLKANRVKFAFANFVVFKEVLVTLSSPIAK